MDDESPNESWHRLMSTKKNIPSLGVRLVYITDKNGLGLKQWILFQSRPINFSLF